MLLMSQLLEKISPPYLKVGSIRTDVADWKIELQPYSDSEHNNAYLMNFEIPYNSETKILTGPRGEAGSAATIESVTCSVGDVPSVKNIGTNTNAKLEFVLPKGVKGDRGEQGPKGDTGPRGEKGEQGPAGIPADIKIGTVSYANQERDDGLVHVIPNEPELVNGKLERQVNFVFPSHILSKKDGVDGKSASIKVGITKTDYSGKNAAVTNVGTEQDAVLNFLIPKGDKGDIGPVGPKGADGKDGQDRGTEFPDIRIGEVKTVAPGQNAEVSANVTKDGRIVRLDFSIPRGADWATNQDGTSIRVTKDVFVDNNDELTGILVEDENGVQHEIIVDVGTADFGGRLASIVIGNVSNGDFASVKNVGTPEHAVLDFVLPRGRNGERGPIGLTGPRGDIGATGPAGEAATIQIGSVNVGEIPGVYNSGDEHNAILNFTLPNSISTGISSVTSIDASKIYFKDNQTLQSKFDNKLLGGASFYSDVNVQTAEPNTNASANLSGTGTSQDPYTLSLKLPRGAKGDKGDDGKAATIKIGTVKQSGNSLMVTNSGNAQNAVLNFTFPLSWGRTVDSVSTNTISSIQPTKPSSGFVGTSSIPFDSGAFNHLRVAGKNVCQYKIFTAEGTFIVPAGTTKVFVTAAAGGGGGSIATGGGGGESIYHQAYNVTPGQTIVISVGAGGNGYSYTLSNASLSGNYSGSDGSSTMIGSLVTLKGGKGGVATFGINNDCYGGNAGGKGGAAGGMMVTSDIDIATLNKNWVGGQGGGTLFGAGGTGGYFKSWDYNKRTGASNGVGFGAGGGGGGMFYISGTGNWYSTGAGSGAPGIVIIEWE